MHIYNYLINNKYFYNLMVSIILCIGIFILYKKYTGRTDLEDKNTKIMENISQLKNIIKNTTENKKKKVIQENCIDKKSNKLLDRFFNSNILGDVSNNKRYINLDDNINIFKNTNKPNKLRKRKKKLENNKKHIIILPTTPSKNNYKNYNL